MSVWKPILCLDFDGVIHSYSSGWKGAATIPDPPVPGAIDAILSYLDDGFDVAVFSSRSKSLFGRRAMQRWLGRAIAEHWESGGSSPSYAEAEWWGDAYAIISRIRWPRSLHLLRGEPLPPPSVTRTIGESREPAVV